MAGIYVHVPFCHAKCAYCDFYSRPCGRSDWAAEAAAYVDGVLAEYACRVSLLGDEPVTTLYIGGGTPSCLPATELTRLINGVAEAHRGTLAELTVEVNPEDVTASQCDALNSCGVNRVSMGVQSLNDNELKAVGRRHTAAEALKAVDTLRRNGIDNLSLDLIYGLPGRTDGSFAHSLQGLLDLAPDHLSAYMLSYEPGTRLTARRNAGKLHEASDDSLVNDYRTLCELTARAGMEHYEISNFAMPGRASRHNTSYWEDVPYLGLGPGAHSYTGGKRSSNPSDLKRWAAGPATAATPEEPLSAAEALNEHIMVRLRTARGLDMPAVATRWGERAAAGLLNRAKPLIDAGKLIQTADNRLYIPEPEWLVADAIMVDLFEG